MPADVKIRVVLEYLAEPHTRADLRERFELSNTQSWHLVRWLKKNRCIETETKVINGNACEVHRVSKTAWDGLQ